MSGNGDILSIKMTPFHFLRPFSGTGKDYLKLSLKQTVLIASTIISPFPPSPS
jgi:hypothetical protein